MTIDHADKSNLREPRRLKNLGAPLLVAVALVALFGFMQTRDNAANKAERMIRENSTRHIIAAISMCPEADAYSTQTLVLIVDAPPSGVLKPVGCMRIAKRSYSMSEIR